ncbi:MAG: hypothetical protein HY730_09740 [Candidatus Tectomicrobia bacterium]|uniref:Tellurite resistance methyltransferase TehB-like domain-containing protein n=1 Tax=Tectimicrobiota bacterium TaxID=2528274 RepID=A0A933GN19_UNCTE|nr:hypothetical protein [Candidatus Tectomicrobia bacterium]
MILNWIVADLDSFEIRGQYEAIVNFFYVNKNIMPAIIKSLKTGGILICENHIAAPEPAEEPHGHRFYFQPGELRKLFTGLQVLHYEEYQKDEEGGRLPYLASLVARKG